MAQWLEHWSCPGRPGFDSQSGFGNIFSFLHCYIYHVVRSLYVILSTVRITLVQTADQTVWICRLVCAFVVSMQQIQVFSWSGQYWRDKEDVAEQRTITLSCPFSHDLPPKLKANIKNIRFRRLFLEIDLKAHNSKCIEHMTGPWLNF